MHHKRGDIPNLWQILTPRDLVVHPNRKTTRALKTRIAENHSSIRCKNMAYPVAVHFIEAGHHISALCYIGIEKDPASRRGGDYDRALL